MSDSLWAVGLDVGGTKIAGGVVALPSGEILSKEVILTLPQRGGDAVLSDALALARRLVQEAAGKGTSARGIGVGVAELVDP
jgi:predicted NBD/HSP70 family sugar kinase